MPTANEFDLTSWLDEVFGDDKDTKELIKQKANDAVVNKLKSSVMRLPDYKRSKDELDRLQTSIKDKEEKLDADFESLTKHRGELDGVVKGLKKDIGNERRRAANLVLKLQEIAEENGLDPESLGLDEFDLSTQDPDGGDKVKTGKRRTKDDADPDFDASNFLTKSDLSGISKNILNSIRANQELQDINDEYHDLYGKNLPNRTALFDEWTEAASKAQSRGKAVPEMRDFIETKFDFSTKKQERSKKEEDDRVERRVQEELDKRRRARETETHTAFDGEEIVAGPLVHRKVLSEGNKTVNDPTYKRRGVAAAIANSDSKGSWVGQKG